ncbi:MAG: hypothetical protein IK955_05690 [Clostridia bacterium]|nr:hypothetical protein [Clostridia bacterium]
MKYEFTGFKIAYGCPISKKAASIFAEEIELRAGFLPEIVDTIPESNYVSLQIVDESGSEEYLVEHNDDKIVITSHRLRSLIYGFAEFLKKAVFENGRIYLVKNISIERTPSMKIRGHQLSYTDMNNTVDMWGKEEYERYIRDLMLFGTNMVEADSGVREETSVLMRYSQKEMLIAMSEICVEHDIDLSVWHELWSKDSDEETIEKMHALYDDLPKLDILFPPGGDPGDMQGEAFVQRCVKMKRELQKVFPKIQMWPSAQAPHEYPDWGERFVKEMAKLPEEIDGVIYGPNHAMPLDELRRKIDKRYPIRLYPDIGHNVRCETPVHFDRDDWHYALASTLSREAVNPRPSEYRQYHRITRQYAVGSVTYSEGVNDDVNKFVWGAMDLDFNYDLRECVQDYCRTFFPGADTDAIAELIISLEQNWSCDPKENGNIQPNFEGFVTLSEKYPELMKNWRFVLHLFRAYCDKIVRDRRIFETELITEAEILIRKGDVAGAIDILRTDFSDEYKLNRAKIDKLAEMLFNQIGIQLDVEHYHGMKWERGCTLMTIDNPVTDRRYLLRKLEENPSDALKLIDRNKVEHDEYYFSFAEHGFEVCGKQKGEYYMNFRGDMNFDAELPMCMTKVYDHFNFETTVAGLTASDYKLRITYKTNLNDEITHHKLTVNGNIIHDGKQYGGTRDEEFEKLYLADDYVSIVYDIPEKFIVNGSATLEITEPIDGFMISEFWFTRA